MQSSRNFGKWQNVQLHISALAKILNVCFHRLFFSHTHELCCIQITKQMHLSFIWSWRNICMYTLHYTTRQIVRDLYELFGKNIMLLNLPKCKRFVFLCPRGNGQRTLIAALSYQIDNRNAVHYQFFKSFISKIMYNSFIIAGMFLYMKSNLFLCYGSTWVKHWLERWACQRWSL